MCRSYLSYSGAYSVRIWKNIDQNNSEYGHYSRSAITKEAFQVITKEASFSLIHFWLMFPLYNPFLMFSVDIKRSAMD